MAPPRTRKAAAKTTTSPAKKSTRKATKKAAKKSTGRATGAGAPADPPAEQPDGELPAGELEVRTALISGTTFTDIPVQYVERDGYGVFEGDIILGSAEDLRSGLAATSESATDTGQGLHVGVRPGTRVDAAAPAVMPSAVIVPGASFRWPAGRVPFEIAANLTAGARTQLTAAITHWHDRTRLSIRPRQAEPDWIFCQDSTGCSSWVGRQRNRQDVNLSSACGFGATVHELGHAIGLWHEQSREDRDQFVTVNWNNIEPAQRHNFDQHITDGDDVGGYDYGSIMHYGATAFGLVGADGRRMVTLVPTRPLPPGVIIGQRAGLSIGDRAAVATMYPHLYPNPGNSWVGRFTGRPGAELLYYAPAQQQWYLGATAANGSMAFTRVGDTAGFGNLDDGRPFWTGDFTGNGATDILFYYPGDDNWWLGQMTGAQLTWSHVGNTVGFGHNIFDGRPFWTGDFTGNGSTDVLFYFPGDDNWWLGQLVNGQLSWSHVGNTAGFGHAINDGRPFWVGDFNGDGRTDVLFYFPGDDNWWLGTLVNGRLTWGLAGNTAGFGHAINDGRPFWTGDFTGNGSTDVLFYFPGDDNWWLGTFAGGQLTWGHAGSTAGFGHAINDGRPFWTGDFTGNGSTDVLFYFPGDDNWWLGQVVNGQLRWSHAGNTAGFGHAINDGRSFWIGDFSGNGAADVLFHFRGDLNWWRGDLPGGSLSWTLAGTW